MKKKPQFQLLTWAIRAYRRHAARRSLENLDDHLLRDIGVARCDIPYLVDGRTPPPEIRADAATVFRHIPSLRPRASGGARGAVRG